MKCFSWDFRIMTEPFLQKLFSIIHFTILTVVAECLDL